MSNVELVDLEHGYSRAAGLRLTAATDPGGTVTVTVTGTGTVSPPRHVTPGASLPESRALRRPGAVTP